MSTKARRTALITGAGRNIGRAVALGLAGDGLDVVVNGSTDRAAAEAVAAEARAFGVQALVAMGDVGLREECARVASEALAAFGAVDVLVNNTGGPPPTSVAGPLPYSFLRHPVSGRNPQKGDDDDRDDEGCGRSGPRRCRSGCGWRCRDTLARATRQIRQTRARP